MNAKMTPLMPSSALERYAYTQRSLQRDAAVSAVLHKDTTIDQTLLKGSLLVSRVGHVRGSGGLLQDSNLVLAHAREVSIDNIRRSRQSVGTTGVVDLNGAIRTKVSKRCLFFSQLITQINLLGINIHLDSKVLPRLTLNRRAPQQRIVAIKQLPRIRLQIRLVNHLARLKHDLIRAIIRRLMPRIQILMAQVERPLRIRLDAPVQRLDAHIARAVLVGVTGKLQAGAAEAVLFLENGGVVDGHLEALVLGRVEARVGGGGEEDSVAPGDVVALDVVWVENSVGGVELREGHVGGHAAVEDDGAADGACGAGSASCRCGGCA